jgi:hypothetical protein
MGIVPVRREIKIMKKFLFEAVDVIGSVFVTLASIILGAGAAVAGAIIITFSFVMSFAVPVFCIVAAWGILKYFGVI